MVKGKSLSTLFISSWKYAGACAYLKGTFRYSYFPKGDVTAFGGIVFIKGYLMVPGTEIKY